MSAPETIRLPADPEALITEGVAWFEDQGWFPFPFQLEAWEAWLRGESGIVNAPTGSGKTYSLMMPSLLEARHRPPGKRKGPLLLWITPIRALAREIRDSALRAAEALGVPGEIAIRTGDTSTAERERQRKHPPLVLVTTPESLHLILATRQHAEWLGDLQGVVCDEWHELVGSKRGVMAELALSRLRTLRPGLRTWGISATIGNLEEAMAILLGGPEAPPGRLIRAEQEKAVEILSVLPDAVDELPWAGHLGIAMLEKVVPLLERSQSTLIFTNTRAQCEIWYQRILDAAPDLAGAIAMHHGSLSREIRDWVEQALQEGTLQAVVCTSSLDLGVDFRPVEQIIQIGSPKGVARFLQRAGRSGHRPGALSRLWFVPTHALELVEAAALREALATGETETRVPYIRSFDVLLQYLMTLAVGGGFRASVILEEVRRTWSFASLSDAEWQWALDFLVTGGSMQAYDEFLRMQRMPDGSYAVTDKRTALRHRLSIGAIVSDTSLSIQFVGGKRLGTIEEWFIARLKPGDVFWFAGRSLELVRIRDLTVQVRPATARNGIVPSWMGGRMPLSSNLSRLLRQQLGKAAAGEGSDPEWAVLTPLLEVQARRSHIPAEDEFLIEHFRSREGHHLVFFPFEGRAVHEGMAALIAWRLGQQGPASFSIAMNDYGFELLSPDPIDTSALTDPALYDTRHLGDDIRRSLNEIEMARRRFRDIAGIAGLVFRGFPGREKRERHLQSSASLLFEVFAEYDPDNLLYLQAFEELHTFQLEEGRLRAALDRIRAQRIILRDPGRFTPFAFPIIADRLRESVSSESLADRVQKMAKEGMRS